MQEQLVSANFAATYRLALILTKNPRDAEEVTLDTFKQVLALHANKPEAEFRSWLHRTAANYALMRLRKQRQRQPVLADDLLPRFFESGRLEKKPQAWAERAEKNPAALSAQVHTALAQIPEKFRWILLMHDVENLSYEDIALTLGMSTVAVKSTLHRARMFVRECLSNHFEGAAQ